jgi:hypothetical protein
LSPGRLTFQHLASVLLRRMPGSFSRKKSKQGVRAAPKPWGGRQTRPQDDAASESGSVSTRSNCSRGRGVVKPRAAAAGLKAAKPLSRGRGAVTIGAVLAEALAKSQQSKAERAAGRAAAAGRRAERANARRGGDMAVEGLLSWGREADEMEAATDGMEAAADEMEAAADEMEADEGGQHGDRPGSVVTAADEAALDWQPC